MNTAQKTIKIVAIVFAIFLIATIIQSILFGLSFITGFSNHSNNTIDFNETYQDIEEIELDTAASEIIIKTGDKFEVTASSVREGFRAEKNNKTLKIREKGYTFWNYNNHVGTITITIPEAESLSKLKLSSGAGKIEINGITAKILDLDQGAGLVEIKYSVFQDTKIDGGAGEIRVEDSVLSHLDLDSGAGKVYLDAEILGSSDIDCGVGELQLFLPQEEDYELKVEKGLGSITIGGKEVPNDTTYGSGFNHIDIDGGVGSIKIDFAN